MKKDKKMESDWLSEEELLDNRIKKEKKRSRVAITIICVVLCLLVTTPFVACSGAKMWLRNKISKMNYVPAEDYSFDGSADEEDMETTVPDAPAPDEIPPYEIIEGWYDGNTVAADYEKEVINVLLIGADTLDGNHARSDTMILMSINTVKKKIVFTSFMRDSYLELPGYNYNRLNAAHAKGGPAFLMETIEYNFGIDIDYYAKVDFTSFKDAVDAIGGMTLTVNDVNYNYFYDWDGIDGLSQAQACDGTHTVHLNGEEALGYARTRKGHRVEHSDFGRTLHQRDFLMQFVNSCKGSSLGELNDMLDVLLPHVVTDMPQEEVENQILKILTYISYSVNDARVPCAGSYADYTTSSGAQVLNINVPANAKYVKAVIYG